MRLNSVRAQQWTLLGAFPVAIVNLFHTGGAAAATTLWLAAGLLLPETEVYPYRQKIGPLRESARAFLALAAGWALLAFLDKAAFFLGIYQLWYGNFFAFGIPFISQILTCRLQTKRNSPRLSFILACALSGVCFLLI